MNSSIHSPQIRVAIVDDKAIFRQSLRRLVEKEPDLGVVAEADTGPAGLKEVEEQKPDVILMDSNEPFTDGLETTQKIISTFPDARILILSMDSKSTTAASSCQVGACFPLCKNCSANEILAAIREGYHDK